MHLMTRPAAALVALLLGLALAGCGGDDDDAAGDRPATGQTAAAAFPVSVEHKFGTTRIESEPERVVTVGYTDQDPVLALGVVPVGVGDFLGGYKWRERPWAQEALGGVQPPVVAGQEINFEAVAARRPDLIIAINAGLKKGAYERLSRIAPTVAQSGDVIDFGMPWEDQTMLVGRALGREARARKVVADVKAKFERVRSEHPEFAGKTAILAYGGPDGYGAYSTQDTRSRFFSDLGFRTPKRVDQLAKGSFFAAFSQEQFRLIDQDLVVMYGPQKSITGNRVVRRLDAVRDDRVVYLDLTDQFAGALGFASSLSLPWLLDQAEDTLAAAVDGDPKTAVDQPT
jgi:iron complex transport system substrate-binding protein